MEELSLLLFERMGLLLVLTFILTRIPLFRQLLDREVSLRTSLSFSILFGLFGVAGTYAGVVVEDGRFDPSFWIMPLAEYEATADASLVGVVIGGLLGGPIVGVGAGLITGLHLYGLGGFTALACCLSAPLTGLLAGLIARFFSQERVISPSKALFIGMFAPVLQMSLILILVSPPEKAIQLVNTIGIPMVLTNSVAIAIFTTMIRVALKEEERAAAFAAQRGLSIAERILPHLMKGLTYQTAHQTAALLRNELKAAAVAIADTKRVLAHVGIGISHHLPDEPLHTELARRAIATGEVQVALNREQIQCDNPKCPLNALIIVPFSEAGKVVGLIKIYYKQPQQIRKVEEALATGLGKLITHQLNLALTERMTQLMKDTELRVLQAQINPHFLFNTLNSIVTLIRIDPDLARHVTIQLGTFIRLNLKATSSQLVPIRQELNHLFAYLEIIRIRFADQFTVNCDVEAGLDDVLIPPATLQPLVENSIQHGLKETTHNGRIDIYIQQIGDHVQVVIQDNGTGIPDELLEEIGKEPLEREEGNGIGVYNVNQRLITLFGNESALQIKNREEGGCQISFSIPSSAANAASIRTNVEANAPILHAEV